MRIRRLRALVFLSSITLAVACSSDDDSGDDADSNGDGGGDPMMGDGDNMTGDGDTMTGDGDLGGASGDGDGDDGTLVSNPADPECNLSGTWAVVAKTRTTASGMDQIANRWYLYEISQDGETIEVVRSTNCQVRVEDDDEFISTTVTVSDEALRAIIANDSHAGLRGTFSKNGDVCDLDFEPQYFVFGLPNSYLPDNPSDRPALDDLPALPTEEEPDGAEDWDMDGQLGLGFSVSSLASGTRNSVQRSVLEFESDSNRPEYTITTNSESFRVNNLTEISESVIHATGEFLKSTGSLQGEDHPVDFTRLGDDRGSSEFPSGASLPDTDFDLCMALQDEFPFSLK